MPGSTRTQSEYTPLRAGRTAQTTELLNTTGAGQNGRTAALCCPGLLLILIFRVSRSIMKLSKKRDFGGILGFLEYFELKTHRT